MDARAITKALGGRWQSSYGLCRCPVHADRTPSLKVKDDARKSDGIDVHCFAGCDWTDIKDALTRQRLLPEFEPANVVKLTAPTLPKFQLGATAEDDAKKLKRAELIWRTAKPLADTPGWRYFTEHRGLSIAELGDQSHALRWHGDIGAVVALMTDAVSNEPCGVHRTFLNADATKRDRMMLGKQGVVRLSSDEDVNEGLGIVEGIEDGLAVLLSGWAPIWAATSCGAIARFPVLSGIDALTIFSDNDDAGSKAAETCAQLWTGAGREVHVFSLKGAAP